MGKLVLIIFISPKLSKVARRGYHDQREIESLRSLSAYFQLHSIGVFRQMVEIIRNRFPPGEFVICADGKTDKVLRHDNLSVYGGG